MRVVALRGAPLYQWPSAWYAVPCCPRAQGPGMRPAVLPTGGVRGRGPWQTPPKTAGSGDGVLAKFFVESHPPFSWLVSGQLAVVRPTYRGPCVPCRVPTRVDMLWLQLGFV